MVNERSDFCIFTIRHRDYSEAAVKRGGSDEFTENKRWVTGKRLLEEATEDGMRLPIVFGAADTGGPLVGWAVVDEITHYDRETKCSFSGFRKFKKGDYRKPSLKKKSNGEPLDEWFIKPYAICHTPDYIRTAKGRAATEATRK